MWYAARIVYSVVRHFGYGENRIATEYDIDGGIADVLVVNDSNYATEIEVKVTLADWNNDQYKSKFSLPRPYIRRFYYAIPETLANKIPAWVPEAVGIMVVSCNDRGYDDLTIARPAKLCRAEKLTPYMIERLYRKAYFKAWQMQMHHWMHEIERRKVGA